MLPNYESCIGRCLHGSCVQTPPGCIGYAALSSSKYPASPIALFLNLVIQSYVTQKRPTYRLLNKVQQEEQDNLTQGSIPLGFNWRVLYIRSTAFFAGGTECQDLPYLPKNPSTNFQNIGHER
jgi:hypothetical protein